MKRIRAAARAKPNTRTAVPRNVTWQVTDGRIRITCWGVEPPGMNGQSGTFRTHWSKLKRQKDDLTLTLRAFAPLPMPSLKGKVTIWYTRTYRSSPLDDDNMASSFKLLGDALQRLGVIENDSRKFLRRIDRQQPRGKLGARFVLDIEPGWVFDTDVENVGCSGDDE